MNKELSPIFQPRPIALLAQEVVQPLGAAVRNRFAKLAVGKTVDKNWAFERQINYEFGACSNFTLHGKKPIPARKSTGAPDQFPGYKATVQSFKKPGEETDEYFNYTEMIVSSRYIAAPVPAPAQKELLTWNTGKPATDGPYQTRMPLGHVIEARPLKNGKWLTCDATRELSDGYQDGKSLLWFGSASDTVKGSDPAPALKAMPAPPSVPTLTALKNTAGSGVKTWNTGAPPTEGRWMSRSVYHGFHAKERFYEAGSWCYDSGHNPMRSEEHAKMEWYGVPPAAKTTPVDPVEQFINDLVKNQGYIRHNAAAFKDTANVVPQHVKGKTVLITTRLDAKLSKVRDVSFDSGWYSWGVLGESEILAYKIVA